MTMALPTSRAGAVDSCRKLLVSGHAEATAGHGAGSVAGAGERWVAAGPPERLPCCALAPCQAGGSDSAHASWDAPDRNLGLDSRSGRLNRRRVSGAAVI